MTAPQRTVAEQSPSWNSSTTVVQIIRDRMREQGWHDAPTQELLVYDQAATPLPRRWPARRQEPLAMVVWRTQQDEIVTYGDTVALDLAEHTDAVGRIIAQTADAHVQCMLLRCNGSHYGTFVTVDEEQLLVRVGGRSWRHVACVWS